MKKLFYFFAATAIVAVACTKEAPVNQEEPVNAPAEEYVLFAELPQFTDDITKAAVNDSGYFSWAEGDQINVGFEKSGVDIYRVFTCATAEDAANGKFTYDGSAGTIPEGYNLRCGYYPKDYIGTPSSQTFASPEEAAKGFQMEAKVSGGKLVFAHENAMMKVTVNNVPSFAKTLSVGSVVVNLSLSANSDIMVYVPVPPTASAKLGVNISDASSNTIIQKQTTKAAEIEAGNFYTLPSLNVGTVIKITDSGSIGKNRLSVWNPADNTQNYKFSKTNDYPGKLNSLGGDTYYAILNPYNAAWATKGTFLCFSYDDSDSDPSAVLSAGIYLRDVEFTTESGSNLLITDYHIYPHGSTDATHLYATYATGTYDTPTNITFNVTQSGTQWGTLYWYANNGEEDLSAAWHGTTFTSSFTIPASKVYGKSVILVINNGGNEAWDKTKDLTVDCTSSPNNHLKSVDIELSSDWDTANGNNRIISWTDTEFSPEIIEEPLGATPGAAVTIATGGVNMSNYVVIPSSYAGKTLNLTFDSTTPVEWNNLLINRDYDYGF